MERQSGFSFVRESVLGFGFISGLWIQIGISPKTEIVKAYTSILQRFFPNPDYSILFWAIPTTLMIIAVISAFIVGRFLGLVAVGLAFAGGMYLSTDIGLICLGLAIIIGIIAPYVSARYRNNQIRR